MSDKPLDNLSRDELIALVQSLQQQLESRVLVMEEAGSIARAAMELNGVFLASQRAADQYLESAEAMQARREAEYYRRLAEAEQQAQVMLMETQNQCRILLAQARQGADYYWAELQKKAQQLMSQPELQQLLQAASSSEPSVECFGPDD